MLEVRDLSSIDEFEKAAFEFLLRDEAFYCMPVGIVDQIRQNPSVYSEQHFWVVQDGNSVVGAGWWTPTAPMGLTRMPSGAVDALLGHVHQQGLSPDGLFVPSDMGDRVFERWLNLSGRTVASEMGMRVFRLDRVTPPQPAPGRMRVVEESDRALIEEWHYCFAVDCHLPASREKATLGADRLIQSRTLYIWEVDGRPVAMTGVSGKTPQGIRINAVYTPPDLRGHGYASQLVAQVSQNQLDAGRRFCFLFTDLANPTSNSIYQKLGYRPVGDWAQRSFIKQG